MSIKKHIPNLLTLLNLLSGSLAVLFAVNNDFLYASAFVALGIFFDFFDGFLARKLQVEGMLGLQLDSLADMVTSGLVPGIVMFKLLSSSIDIPDAENSMDWNQGFQLEILDYSIIPIIGLLITLASAYRLAKFNIDVEQQSSFKGLPTPANALLIISLPLILEYQYSELINAILLNTYTLIGITLLSCYLLNSSIGLLALKFKNYGISDNIFKYLLLGISVILLLWLKFIAIPLIILIYILLSILSTRYYSTSKPNNY